MFLDQNLKTHKVQLPAQEAIRRLQHAAHQGYIWGQEFCIDNPMQMLLCLHKKTKLLMRCL